MICQTVDCINQTFAKIVQDYNLTASEIDTLLEKIIESPIGSTMYVDKLLSTIHFLELSDENIINTIEIFLKNHSIDELCLHRNIDKYIDAQNIFNNESIFKLIVSQDEQISTPVLIFLFNILTVGHIHALITVLASKDRINTAIVTYIDGIQIKTIAYYLFYIKKVF